MAGLQESIEKVVKSPERQPGPHAGLSLGELVARALVAQREGGAGSDTEDLSFIVELHERTNRETYDTAAALTDSQDADERILGIRIMRELGPWGARTFRADAVPLLRRLVDLYESDFDTLSWLLNSLAWQGESDAVRDLLRFTSHSDEDVREAAFDGLSNFIDRHEIQSDLRAALLSGIRDPLRSVRYSAVYDVAHWLDVSGRDLQEALSERLGDDDEPTSSYAAAGLARTESGWRRLLAHHDIPQIRVGDPTSEYFAVRPVAHRESWSDAAVVVRGTYVAWSALCTVSDRDWGRWAKAFARYRSDRRPFTMTFRADLDLKITLGWHPEGVPEVTCRIGTVGKRWHERLSLCWQLRDQDLQDLDQGLRSVQDRVVE